MAALRNFSTFARDKMKKSQAVALVISGALLAGCNSSDDLSEGWDTSQTYTNNTHRTGVGYYHAPYRAWYPFPYNYYDPARGYYHGGRYTPTRHESNVTASSPAAKHSATKSSSHVRRGGFTSRSGSS